MRERYLEAVILRLQVGKMSVADVRGHGQMTVCGVLELVEMKFE